MKVGYVLKVFPRLSQTFIVNELRAHEAAGQELVIFSLHPPQASDQDIVVPALASELVQLGGSSNDLAARLAHAATQRGVSHLHAHFAKLATQVARQAARTARISFSFTAHARDIFEESVDERALAQAIQEASAVVTISQCNVDYLERKFARRATLVYNGLPLEQLRYDPLQNRGRTVLAVGRLIEKKGFGHLVDACQILAQRNLDFDCEILGAGPLKPILKAHIERLGLCARVKLLGPCSQEQVFEHMRRAALLAVPCVVAQDGDRDGLPTVLLEAMAVGTPCIGTDVTGTPEALTPEQTGLAVAQADSRGLADACQRLLENPQLGRALAARARTHIEARFSSAANSRALRQAWRLRGARIVFRVHNRRGLGHWMRSHNLASEILALAPDAQVRLFARSRPPFPSGDARIVTHVAKDPERMHNLPEELLAFAPHVIVDDTIVPGPGSTHGARSVYVMRRCASEQQARVFASESLRNVDRIVIPHSAEEFGYDLPAALAERAEFVGPIARRASADAMRELRERYAIEHGLFVLVSTPGGGGFDADGAAFTQIVLHLHALLAERLARLLHVFVRGPNSTQAALASPPGMVVVETEAEMASLLALATVVVSAGGYNTVSEVRLAKIPAFFLPGTRSQDDQRQRVIELERKGLARAIDPSDPMRAAQEIASGCLDSNLLADMRAAYAGDAFEPGNRRAAEIILQCAQS